MLKSLKKRDQEIMVQNNKELISVLFTGLISLIMTQFYPGNRYLIAISLGITFLVSAYLLILLKKRHQEIMAQNNKELILVLFTGVISLITPQLYPGNMNLMATSLVITFLVSAYLMHKVSGIFNIYRMTIANFWYFTYLVMIYYSCFWVIQRAGNEPGKYAYLFAVESVLLAVPLGIFFINKILRFKNLELDNFFNADIDYNAEDGHICVIYSVFLFFAISFTILYFSSLKIVPLFYMMSHPRELYNLTLLREKAFKLIDPRWSSSQSSILFYIYLFLRTTIYPFIVLISLGFYLMIRNRKWLILFLVTLIFSLFYASASIARAPVAAIFLRIAFFIYLFKKGKINKKAAIILLILILIFPVVVTQFLYTGKNGFLALETIYYRLVYSPSKSLYDYFYLFPHSHPFLHGQTLLKPFLILFNKNTFYIENYVYKSRQYYQGIETGHANAAFPSNLYADFGIWGVLIGSFLIGALMQWLQIYLLRQRKSVINIAVYAFMLYAFLVLNSGSITSVLFVNGVIPVLFLAFGFQWFGTLFKNKLIKNGKG